MSLQHDIRSDPIPLRYEGKRPLSRLQYEREQRGWSQLELAKKVCATATSVSRWESRKVSPHPYYCRKLSEVLEISLEELFPGRFRSSNTNQVHAIAPVMPTQANGLRQAREQRGFSQKELAEALGTTRVSVTRWEGGRGFPKPSHRQKLCQFLGVSLEELFPDTISKPSSPIQEEAEETRTHLPAFHSSGQRLFDY